MYQILALILCMYIPALFSNGFADTTRQTNGWSDGSGKSYGQPNGYTASDPIPDCPTTGIYLKNNSPRQETFTVTFTDSAQNALSVLPNNTRCIHTTGTRKIQNISIFPFLGPTQAAVANGTNDMMTTGFNGSGDALSLNGSYQPSKPRHLPAPPLTDDQIKNYTKSFSQFFKDTLYYPLSSANKICRTMTYSGFTLQCWKSTPNLTPWYTETKPAQIIPGKKG